MFGVINLVKNITQMNEETVIKVADKCIKLSDQEYLYKENLSYEKI